MKKYALQKGICQQDMIVGNKAKRTYHHMMYVNEKMKWYHFRNCMMITKNWYLIKAE